MKTKTTFKRWDHDDPTASWRDFFDIEVVDTVHINKSDYKKDVVTVKVIEKPCCPEIFSCLNKNYRAATFTGTSILRGDDTYNELTGADIAEHKAMCKAYKYIARKLEEARKVYMGLVEDCIDFADIFMAKAAKQEACWKKLGKC